MTNIRDNTLGFEAKKHRLHQNQDGLWQLTFVVQQSDMPEAILKAPMGQRFMVGAAMIGDNEEVEKPESEGEKAVKLAAVLCSDREFQTWFGDRTRMYLASGQLCADKLRWYLEIASRSELATNETARKKFYDLYERFNQDTGRTTWRKE